MARRKRTKGSVTRVKPSGIHIHTKWFGRGQRSGMGSTHRYGKRGMSSAFSLGNPKGSYRRH